jgi:predicted permease
MLKAEADSSLMGTTINVLYPALILTNVVGNDLLRDPKLLVTTPMLGFGTVVAGFLLAWLVGPLAGLRRGSGRRTFALSIGIYNYGYLPIPIILAAFGGGELLGVLFVLNLGVELALWSVGLVLLSGGDRSAILRRLLNGPLVAIVVALALNLSGGDGLIPAVVTEALRVLGLAAIPMGLLLVGATLRDVTVDLPTEGFLRVGSASIVLRLLLLPALFIAAARWLPLAPEVVTILLIQASMPGGVIPIVLARHYGGQPRVAVQEVLATTAIGLISIPLVITLGFQLAG